MQAGSEPIHPLIRLAIGELLPLKSHRYRIGSAAHLFLKKVMQTPIGEQRHVRIRFHTNNPRCRKKHLPYRSIHPTADRDEGGPLFQSISDTTPELRTVVGVNRP